MDALLALTRQDALQSLQHFLPLVPGYALARNHVQEDHRNVSRLSAAIRFRLLLEDEIIDQTLAHYSFAVAEKWLQEVCWRRYWKGWLERHPGVWTQWRQRVAILRRTLPADTLTKIRAVEAGQSGVACMDRIAHELTRTGYLHNHARMWWAGFWIHAEQLPWELGADFFFRHLLDADPASNTLSWRWVAGLHTRGKTYLVRLPNLEKYAPHYLAGSSAGQHRLADGAVTAATVEASAVPCPQPLPDYATSLDGTHGRTGLWLHPDDLVPEVGPLAGLTPVCIAACPSDRRFHETYQLSSQRMASLDAVLADAMARGAAHFGCPAAAVESDDPVQGIVDWAAQHALETVVAFAPMVGPIHDLLPRLTQQLGSRGIRLTLIRRASDHHVFPMAKAGFFSFWQELSRSLQAIRPAE